jgi:flagellar biosynthetic protein FliO
MLRPLCLLAASLLLATAVSAQESSAPGWLPTTASPQVPLLPPGVTPTVGKVTTPQRRYRRAYRRVRYEAPVHRPAPPKPAVAKPAPVKTVVAKPAPPKPVAVKPVVKPKVVAKPTAPTAKTTPVDLESRPLTEYRAAKAPAVDTTRLIGDIGVKLALVIGLMLVAAFVRKRFVAGGAGRKATGAPDTKSSLKITETLTLSPQQSVHVVAVGDKRFLVGSSPQQVALLAELHDGEPVELAPGAPAPSSPAPAPVEPAAATPLSPAADPDERFVAILHRLQQQNAPVEPPARESEPAPPLPVVEDAPAPVGLFGGVAPAPRSSLFGTAPARSKEDRDAA